MGRTCQKRTHNQICYWFLQLNVVSLAHSLAAYQYNTSNWRASDCATISRHSIIVPSKDKKWLVCADDIGQTNDMRKKRSHLIHIFAVHGNVDRSKWRTTKKYDTMWRGPPENSVINEMLFMFAMNAWMCVTHKNSQRRIDRGRRRRKRREPTRAKIAIFDTKWSRHAFICCFVFVNQDGFRRSQYLLWKFIHQHPWGNKSGSKWIPCTAPSTHRAVNFSRAQNISLAPDGFFSLFFSLARSNENILRGTKLPRPCSHGLWAEFRGNPNGSP